MSDINHGCDIQQTVAKVMTHWLNKPPHSHASVTNYHIDNLYSPTLVDTTKQTK